ncbi:MAG: DUF2934 domain-containing protein [Nitrospirota bacterium]
MSKSSDLHGDVAKTAYNFYVKRGMIDGNDLEDWLKAEKIVMGQQAKTRGNKTGTTLQRKSQFLQKK